ncbi:single-stranded DNA-binding protein [Patescibacteria group bacterium]|nr:single-stranded DNA-binding protein [Patescibacteria group bacterium]
MAFSLNRAQLIGNLTRDPEVRQTSGGKTVCSFSVATNSTWTDASGQRQEKAEFHNIVAWGKLAEICAQYMSKGRKIYAEGRIQTRDWEGEDGVKRYRTEIVADNVILLDRSGAPVEGGFEREANSSALRKEEAPALQEEEVSIDDLPF